MPSVKKLASIFSAIEDAVFNDENARTTGRAGAIAPPSQLHPQQDHDLTPGTVGRNSKYSLLAQSSLKSDVLQENSRLLGEASTGNDGHDGEELEMDTLIKPSVSEPDPIEPHAPIPAAVIFARNAAPLHLPDLDAFLAELPPPSFSHFTSGVISGKKVVGIGMFPPMDRLAAIHGSLADLQTNSAIPSAWKNRNSILGGITNAILSITGSSVVATFYSLHGLVDVVQIFALICSTIIPFSKFEDVKDNWKTLFLGAIPNVLALNFGTTFVQSTTVLAIFIIICMVLLYLLWSMTNKILDQTVQEGFPPVQPKGRGWGLIAVSFTLSVLYLPMSTVVAHALLWSQDFWTIPNPYINSTMNPPVLPPLGPSDEFLDPLDFCYTTTMKRNEVNFAPLIVIVSAAAFVGMTIWFPLRLCSIVRQVVPRVDRFTERGTRRSNSELDREYQRLLERDTHPMNFLYSDFRRGWGTYRSTYLFAKLSALLIVSVISPDNCLFRTVPRNVVLITRQAILSAVMLFFFLLQCFRAPFIDPVNNASEWISRLSYFITSLLGLVVTLGTPGGTLLDGPVLYVIYILTYGFAVYFIFIDFGWVQRIVKRLTGRIDFSIDIFSPRLDLSSSSPHVKRRTWQETITTLFLTSHQCQIPKEQPMRYASAKDSEHPPYLLGFRGSPGERHVENLKILHEVGLYEYTQGAKALESRGRDHALWDWIQREYTGPDMLWAGPDRPSQARFGTAWWIPFPPTLVFRFDDGGGSILNRIEQFDAYVHLNKSKEVQKKRQLRLAIRALDGQICSWPYEYREPVGSHRRLCCFGRRYRARRILQLYNCVLEIQRDGRLVWQDYEIGSGLNVELVYGKGIKVSGDVLGITDEWELTPTLARFLSLNQALILARLPALERSIGDFRRHHRKEYQFKAAVLSYQFLPVVYNTPQRHDELVQVVVEEEQDLRVRDLVLGAEDAFIAGYERFRRAVSSEAGAWWYIFWDDFWRRNRDTVKSLRLHEQDFSPYYPTSIAYRLLPRPVLEAFLRQRGLYGKPSLNSFFHTGFLNKIYFWLSEIVFRNTDQAVRLHVGEGVSELDLSAIDALAHTRSSSLGTGGGTDHDDVSIRARPIYRWEGILEDPIQNHQTESGWFAKVGVWLGVTPLWRAGIVTKGIALDVKLENGRYVMLPRTRIS